MSGKCVLATCFVLGSLLEAQAPPMRVPVAEQEMRLVHQVRPVYPKLARQARIQGTVKLAAIIDEGGVVERLQLLSGHPLLVKAAIDAVKQCRYEPAMRNGVPVPVITTIEANFTLSNGPAPPTREPDGLIWV